MREIKFRAWNPISSAMFWSERCKNLSFFFDYVGGIDLADGFALMQYTGLKDKNGKEIYEGDIVRGWNDTLYAVAYQSSSGKYDCCDFKAWEKGYYDAYLDLCDIGQVGPGECHPLPCIPTPQFNNAEVIGNIYENKELLNE